MSAGRAGWNPSVQDLCNFHCDETDSGALRLLSKSNDDSVAGFKADQLPPTRAEVKTRGSITVLTHMSS
jgi:hypothetical protein